MVMVGSAKMLYIEGRQYAVDKFYTPEPQPDYVDAAMITVLQIHLFSEPGDILVFLTGQEEIEALEALLQQRVTMMSEFEGKQDLLVCPLYSALPRQQQLRVFEMAPCNTRKVVLATNIAETSITINGIRYVLRCTVQAGHLVLLEANTNCRPVMLWIAAWSKRVHSMQRQESTR
jgi:ATP-dependent RNA helicase DHX8/PRP22